MALIDVRVLAPFQARRDRCRDASGMRPRPERIILGVRPGTEPSAKPPVRIFLGTEPAQYRAERIFVWSIERVRDPSRVYEIHLMKELAGFDRRMWLTGFTNYRCAIPHFAGGQGRAIWNDVDQVYLSDPAELFDMDLGGHGFVTVPPLGPEKRVDSSVMLMDCARMLPVWSLEAAQRGSSKKLLREAVAIPGLHGLLGNEWNARDSEYTPGRSKLIHYTILHTQPWCPIPKRYVYQRNPIGHTWYDLERSADAAGFQVFDRERPSSRFQSIATAVASPPAKSQTTSQADSRDISPRELQDLRELCEGRDAHRLLELRLLDAGLGRGARGNLPKLDVEEIGAFADLPKGGPPRDFDGVICTDGLEHLPDEDVPWVVEELFARARGFVYASVDEPAPARTLPDGRVLETRERGWSWWRPIFEKAGTRHEGVSWKLVVSRRGPREKRTRRQCEGGPRAEDPRVWVLSDGSPRHDSQSDALARALGWPVETKALRFTVSSHLDALMPFRSGRPLGLSQSRSALFAPPWPDLVIASGRRAAGAARWVGERSDGHTRVVQLDRRAGLSAEPFDVVISNETRDLPLDPRRIETTAPLTPVNPDRLDELVTDGEASWQDAARPRVALLGGGAERHGLPSDLAQRVASDVRDWAAAAGGTVLSLTPSSGTDLLPALAAADIVVVSGDSQAQLALAASTGKPVYIYSLPARRLGVFARVAEWIAARANAAPLNGRGTVRPQRGLEYLCARLMERGIVLGRRDTEELRRTLIERGIAQPFGTPLRVARVDALHEADDVAGRLRALLGFAATA
jgi:mitochondrial fission protein ELM1